MYRITNHIYSEAIGYAFELLPIAISKRLNHVHFFTGTDPLYAGLHSYVESNDKRSYRTTAHVVYPCHQGILNKQLRNTTVVLPIVEDADPYVIVHELGHCLDEVLGFKHSSIPVNSYAKTNRLEAFAEAFASQYFWLGTKAEDIFQADKATQYLFKELIRL